MRLYIYIHWLFTGRYPWGRPLAFPPGALTKKGWHWHVGRNTDVEQNSLQSLLARQQLPSTTSVFTSYQQPDWLNGYATSHEFGRLGFVSHTKLFRLGGDVCVRMERPQGPRTPVVRTHGLPEAGLQVQATIPGTKKNLDLESGCW